MEAKDKGEGMAKKLRRSLSGRFKDEIAHFLSQKRADSDQTKNAKKKTPTPIKKKKGKASSLPQPPSRRFQQTFAEKKKHKRSASNPQEENAVVQSSEKKNYKRSSSQEEIPIVKKKRLSGPTSPRGSPPSSTIPSTNVALSLPFTKATREIRRRSSSEEDTLKQSVGVTKRKPGRSTSSPNLKRLQLSGNIPTVNAAPSATSSSSSSSAAPAPRPVLIKRQSQERRVTVSEVDPKSDGSSSSSMTTTPITIKSQRTSNDKEREPVKRSFSISNLKLATLEVYPTAKTNVEKKQRLAPPAEGISPRLQTRIRVLNEWMKVRPAWDELVDREIVHPDPIKSGGDNRYKPSESLNGWLKRRPSSSELVERGIIKDEQKFSKKREKFKQNLLKLINQRRKEKQQKMANTDEYYLLAEEWYKVVEEMDSVSSSASSSASSSPRTSFCLGTDGPREVRFVDIQFKPNGRLGGGCFGDVFEAYLPGVGKVAAKILRSSTKSEQAFDREIEALRRTLSSEHTVNLKGWSTDVQYCILTELCEGGSVERFLHTQKLRFTQRQALRIAIGVAEGMHYLHTLDPPILHRDISSGNILMHPNADGRVCIGDFGIAVQKTEKKSDLKLAKNGNPRYRAPEISNGQPYSRKADVYSFGNLFYEMLTGTRPFQEISENEVGNHIAKGATPKFPRDPPIDRRLRRLVRRCWRFEPRKRPSFGRLLEGMYACSAALKREEEEGIVTVRSSSSCDAATSDDDEDEDLTADDGDYSDDDDEFEFTNTAGSQTSSFDDRLLVVGGIGSANHRLLSSAQQQQQLTRNHPQLNGMGEGATVTPRNKELAFDLEECTTDEEAFT